MSIESCDAFRLGKSRGIQNREWLLRKKANDALKRDAKEKKKARKIALRERELKKEAKENGVPTSLEDFMPPECDDSHTYSCAKYLTSVHLEQLAAMADQSPPSTPNDKESDRDSDEIIFVDDMERGLRIGVPEEGWALL